MAARRAKTVNPRGEHVVLWCGCALHVTRTPRSNRTSRVIVDTGGDCGMPAHTLGALLGLSQMLPPSEHLVLSRH